VNALQIGDELRLLLTHDYRAVRKGLEKYKNYDNVLGVTMPRLNGSRQVLDSFMAELLTVCANTLNDSLHVSVQAHQVQGYINQSLDYSTDGYGNYLNGIRVSRQLEAIAYYDCVRFTHLIENIMTVSTDNISDRASRPSYDFYRDFWLTRNRYAGGYSDYQFDEYDSKNQFDEDDYKKLLQLAHRMGLCVLRLHNDVVSVFYCEPIKTLADFIRLYED